MQNKGTLLLKCVDKNKKMLFKVESISLIGIYAFIMADMKMKMHENIGKDEDLKIKWEYHHYLDDENNGISARFVFLNNQNEDKVRTGVIFRVPRNDNSDFSVYSDHEIYTSYKFLSLAEKLNLKLFDLSDGDIDIARTAMLFALRSHDHHLWG